MDKPAQQTDGQVEEMAADENQGGGEPADPGNAQGRLGQSVDHHGDDAGGQAERQETGIGEGIAKVPGYAIEGVQPAEEPSDWVLPRRSKKNHPGRAHERQDSGRRLFDQEIGDKRRKQ